MQLREIRLAARGHLERAGVAAPRLMEGEVVHLAGVHYAEHGVLGATGLPSGASAGTHGVRSAHHVPPRDLVLSHLLRQPRHGSLSGDQPIVEQIAHALGAKHGATVSAHDGEGLALGKILRVVAHVHLDDGHGLCGVILSERVGSAKARGLVCKLAYVARARDEAGHTEGSEVVHENAFAEV